MNEHERRHILKSVVLLATVCLIARATNWIGPAANRPVVPEVLWPWVLAISGWGLFRLIGCRPHNPE